MASRSPAHRGLCLLLAGLTGCASPRPPSPRLPAEPERRGFLPPRPVRTWGARSPDFPVPTSPVLSPGNLVSLRCPDDSKLNGDFRVQFNGELVLPYDVTIQAAGVALGELRRKLTRVYRPYFKSASGVELRLKERRVWLDVRGLVEKPGRLLAESDASLDSVIGLAGGLGKDPAPLYVRIQKGSTALTCDLRRYYSRGGNDVQVLGWLGGEVLFFQRETVSLSDDEADPSASPPFRDQIILLGEVRRPGEVSLVPGADYVDSIVQAGGFTERADLDRIDVIRQAGGKKSARGYSWRELQRAPPPRRGDVVMVYADRTTKTERRINLFTGVATALAAILTGVVLVLSYNRGKI